MLFSPKNPKTKIIQNGFKNFFLLSFFLVSTLLPVFFRYSSVNAATGINEQISFQGKVVNADGTNVSNGSYNFLFCLYTTASPATPCTAIADNDAVWRESKSLTVTDGIFQSNLGDTTTLPGSVDFNTDNIYLGINFNSDGQMTPLVRFTAAPYALNAAKVAGLTVTDTTGTLTIPNSETISFGGSFSTTASNDVALTTSGATTLTLPTTGTLATLAGTEVLTNKTIGSTGLTFSGATTDITTATGESLVIVANGAGVIDLQDATTVDSLTADTGGVSIASGQSYTGAGAVTLSSATTTALTVDSGTTGALNLGTGNNAKTISLGTGTAGNSINIGTDNTTTDTITIGSLLDNIAITSDSWSITDAGALTVVSCSGCGGGGGTLDSAYTAGNTISTDSGNNVSITLQEVATPTSFVIENQDTAGVSGQRIYNSITSGTLTNGLLIEQTGAGTLTNAIQIAETTGTITDGILITGTLDNILNTASIDITGAGAITGATGITSSGTITLSGLSAGGVVQAASGTGILSVGTLGASSITADSLDFTEFQDQLDLDASTDINAPSGQAYVLSITNEGTGNSFLVNDVAGDTSPFLIDAAGNTTIGATTNNSARLLVNGDATSNSFRLIEGSFNTSTARTAGTTGIYLNIGTNVTGANDVNNTGASLVLPATTNSNTASAYGLQVTSGAISQSNSGKSADFYGVNVANPSITGTGVDTSVTATGLYVTTGSITTAGTQAGVRVIAAGVGAGTLYGVNIGAITAGAGTETAINIGAGWDTYLDTATIDITGAGAITGATGITSSGTITFSGLSSAGIVTNTSGGVLGTVTSVPIANGGTNATTIGSAGSIAYSTGSAYAFSAVGTTGQAIVSGGTGAPTFFAPTAGSILFAGTSGILEQDNASFFFDNTTNRLGLGTTSPSSTLDILGTTNALRLSYDVSNYATLSTASDGTLSLTSSNVSESQFVIGTGASVDDSIAFDGASQDYYAGLDHTTGYFTIGTGFTVGSSTLFAIDATGNVGIGTGVTAPGARLDLALTSTNTTGATEYGQRSIISDTGVVTTGTDTTYGSSTAVTRTGATGGTINTYGLNILATTDNAGAGTSTAYGALINTGTSGATNADTVYGMRIETEANTSTTAYGLYVDAGTQAGTEYSAVFMNGSVGVGDATPDALLDFDFTQTSGTLLGISAPASVTLAGLLTGISEDFTNNLTATNQSVTGFATVLPTVTNTGAGSYRYTGFEVYGGDLTQNTGAGQTRFYGTYVANPAITQTTGVTSADGYYVATGINITGGIQQGVDIDAVGVSAGTLNAVNISAITGGAGTETALNIGSGWDTILDTASLDITGAGAITGATGVSSTTGTFSSTLAANGGITFDASTDTVGAFTSAGTINMSTNILENIGNAGTDFVATTGALTLAGVLTANGGITLASSQIFTASSLSYLDLGAITHGTTAVQGLRLPQAASASPSSPSSGEGYLAWDAGGNQLIYYNGSAWVTVGGGSSDLQTTYGNDVDGGNVTISLTADDDGLVFTNPTSGGNNLSTFLLQLDQANTTANMLALDIIQSSNASNAVNVTANAIDTESGLAITTNGLTAGSALTVTSSATNFSGNLAGISFTGSNVNNTGNVLAVSNTGTLNTNVTLFVDHQATGTNNLAVRVNDVSGDTTPFVIDGAGNVGIGTSAPARILDIVQSASAPQLRLSKDLTYYSEMTVDSAGDLLIGATGTDIRALSENVWVCDNDACPALTLTGDGNIFVENVIKFGNGVYMKNDSATELGVYDNDDQAMLIFDEL